MDSGGSYDVVTAPDRIDPEALDQVRLLEAEHVRRVWRTATGFLVMTNLRCIEVSRKPQLFSKTEWQAGPSLFFYNLSAPKVMFHRYVRLSEEWPDRPVVLHFFVHNPYAVAQEIQEARAAGRNEWLDRRVRSEASVRESHRRWDAAGRGAMREAEKVRCNFCGNLMSVTALHCPSCGAPHR